MRDFSRCFYHHNAIRISVWVDGEFEKSRHSFAIFAHYYFDIFFFSFLLLNSFTLFNTSFGVGRMACIIIYLAEKKDRR